MKLSSVMPRVTLIALVSMLILTGANPRTRCEVTNSETSRPYRSSAATEEGFPDNPKKKVAIILHGLMVGRYWNPSDKPEDKRFEVGIVTGAKNHNHFTLTYYDAKNPKPKCPEITMDHEEKLIFEIRKNNKPITRDIEMWHSQSQYDRPKDSSLILNMEGDRLYNDLPRHGTFLRGKHFEPIFHFRNGKIKTHTPTLRLLARKQKSQAPCVGIGSIAEVVMVEIEITHEEELVLANEKEDRLWWRTYDQVNPNDEVRVLNLGDQHGSDCTKPYDGAPDCKSRALTELTADYFSHPSGDVTQSGCAEFKRTDLQLYYDRVFRRAKKDRFELKCPECRECGVIKDGVGPLTVPPYRCGMTLVTSTEIK